MFFGYLLFALHFLLLFFVDKIFTLNDSSFNFYKSFFTDKVYLIENFIDEKAYKIRNKNNEYKFIFVGSFSKRKNVISLINSFASYVKKNKIATLTLFGDGPLRRDVENFIIKNELQKNIYLKEYTYDIYNLYSKFDYYVSFSYSEGTSRAVLEALYCGLPCLIADVDSNNQIVSDNFNGVLFALGYKTDNSFESLVSIKPRTYSILKIQYRFNSVYNKLKSILKIK